MRAKLTSCEHKLHHFTYDKTGSHDIQFPQRTRIVRDPSLELAHVLCL